MSTCLMSGCKLPDAELPTTRPCRHGMSRFAADVAAIGQRKRKCPKAHGGLNFEELDDVENGVAHRSPHRCWGGRPGRVRAPRTGASTASGRFDVFVFGVGLPACDFAPR